MRPAWLAVAAKSLVEVPAEGSGMASRSLASQERPLRSGYCRVSANQERSQVKVPGRSAKMV